MQVTYLKGHAIVYTWTPFKEVKTLDIIYSEIYSKVHPLDWNLSSKLHCHILCCYYQKKKKDIIRRKKSGYYQKRKILWGKKLLCPGGIELRIFHMKANDFTHCAAMNITTLHVYKKGPFLMEACAVTRMITWHDAVATSMWPCDRDREGLPPGMACWFTLFQVTFKSRSRRPPGMARWFTLFQVTFSLLIAFSTSLESSVIEVKPAAPVPVDTAQ